MTDWVTLSYFLAAVVLAVIFARLTYYQKELKSLRISCESWNKEKYDELAALLKKKNRDPQRTLGIAAEYFNTLDIVQDLQKLSRLNFGFFLLFDVLVIGIFALFWLFGDAINHYGFTAAYAGFSLEFLSVSIWGLVYTVRKVSKHDAEIQKKKVLEKDALVHLPKKAS